MRKFKIFMFCLYAIFCVYAFFHSENYENIFWGVSFVLGGFITILSGMLLIFLGVAFLCLGIQKFLNWVFERDIFD